MPSFAARSRLALIFACWLGVVAELHNEPENSGDAHGQCGSLTPAPSPLKLGDELRLCVGFEGEDAQAGGG